MTENKDQDLVKLITDKVIAELRKRALEGQKFIPEEAIYRKTKY
jgi:hypothetical protein